jgi:hypothetical protein
VVLIAFVFNDRGESGGSTTTVTTESPEEGSGESGGGGGGTGEAVEHNGILYTITGTEVTDEVGSYTADGEYVIVHLDVAYAGTDTFWRDEQHLYTSSGEQFEEDYDATGTLGDSMWSDLPGDGTPVSLSIVFDVPSAADITHIGLSSETYGGDEIEVEISP